MTYTNKCVGEAIKYHYIITNKKIKILLIGCSKRSRDKGSISDSCGASSNKKKLLLLF